MPEIGQALREARMRARIDVSEIEAQTKIRAKYLRALENEEWDLLPGPTFVKSFLRTYAQALHLDDKALLEEYRQSYERPHETDRSEIGQQPIVARARRTLGQRGGQGHTGPRGVTPPSRAYTIAIAVVSLLIVVLVVALLSGGGGSSGPSTTARSTARTHHALHTARPGGSGARLGSEIVALSLQPTAPVYVCLISATGAKLIPGVILTPNPTNPAAQPTYHSHRFLLTLGNASVKLIIDGAPRSVPPSSQAIGYSITKAGGRHPLALGELPTCK
jgi:hypothetical protein